MEENKFKLLKYALLIFSLVFLVGAGCSKKGTDTGVTTIEVAYWGNPEEINIITKTVQEWEKEHPDVRVQLTHVPVNGYAEKLLTRVAGGSAPDIMFAEINVFVPFADKAALLDLTPFIKKDSSFNLDEFFPEVVDRFTVDGRIYGIPRDTAPIACIYYNKKLFDEAEIPYPKDDWNWDDFLEKAKKLTKISAGGGVIQRVIQYGFYGWAWQDFVYSNGGRIVDDVKNPTRCLLNEPRAIEGLQYYVDLTYKHKVMPESQTLANLGMGANKLFMTGKVAMYLSGIWETPILQRIKDFDWDIVMFPKGPDGLRAFATGGSAYCILKDTKHPELAWEVLKCLAGDEGQIMLAETGLAQPANKRIAEGPHWAGSKKKPLNKGMLNEAVQYVVYDPFHPGWKRIQELYINQEFDLMFNGKKTPQEVTEKIVPKIDEALRITK